MEQLTLEQAAHNNFPAGSKAGTGFYARIMYENKKASFKAGAEWQKEQFRRILNLALDAASELDSLGETFISNDIKTELERLQTL